MGGSVMPCGAATVPAKGCLRGCNSSDQRASLPVLARDDPHELVRGARDVVVHDHVVELVGRGELDASRLEPTLALLGTLGAAAHEPADELVPAGRGEKHEAGVGHGLADLTRALQVDLEDDRLARREPLLDGRPQRAVAVAAVHDGPLEERALLDRPREGFRPDEAVVHPVHLAGARVPRGRRDGQPDMGIARAQVRRHGPLAYGCGTCEHGQPSGVGGQPNLSIRAACWCGPRPRTRRVSEMPISAMIARALTLPTPGRDSSNETTLSLPMTSSVCPVLITSESEPCEYLSLFFTSARAWRALAAFSSAAARCSGV